MTLLDYHTNHSDGSLSATDTESYTTKYFMFLPAPDLEERAELAPFDLDLRFVPPLDDEFDGDLEDLTDAGGHADLSTAYARCSDGAGTLTHLFFSEDNFDLARAKAICSKCRLAPTCLTDALEREEPYGVWGGQLLVDGVIVEVKRGRGRPPKLPRPLLTVDEVPVPPHMVA
jgi:WhiB family redox-sensing transcriptional regulator